MRALVIGGTGHIGSACVRQLVSCGWSVTVMSRRLSASRNLVDIPAHWRVGDGHDAADLMAAAGGMDLVVDAAAPYPVHPYAPTCAADRDPIAFAVRRTRALLHACDRAGAHLIAIGSFVTHRGRHDAARTVIGRVRSRTIRRIHPYFAVKSRVERELMDAAARGQPVGILNPTGCLGPWDLKPRRLCLVPMVATGDLPATASDVVNFIDVRDVAIAVTRMADLGLFGEPVLLAGHNLRFGGYFAAIAKVAGVTPPRLAAPASLGALALVGAERALALIGARPAWPALSMCIVAECGHVAQGDGQRRLGVAPRTIDETVRDAFTWYRSIGYC